MQSQLFGLIRQSSDTIVRIWCRNTPSFYFNNAILDIVEDFSYLGVKFNYNGKFNKTTKYLCDQARKAMFAVLKKSRTLCLDIDLQLQLFDSMVTPILLYGVEVWGVGNIDIVKQFQLKYLKLIMNVKKSTPSVMVFGELGTLPIDCVIKCRVLNFWCKIINSKPDKVCNIMYKLMFELDRQNVYHSPWIAYVKKSLQELGFAGYWINQSVLSPSYFKNIVKSRIKDQYVQMWHEQVFNSRQCFTYRIFKSSFELEPYFKLLPRNLALSLCRFRWGNHKLPIEKGRYINLDHDLRYCHLCPNNS
jgi:hypothetical protein